MGRVRGRDESEWGSWDGESVGAVAWVGTAESKGLPEVVGLGAKRGDADRARVEAPLVAATSLRRASAFDGVSLSDSEVLTSISIALGVPRDVGLTPTGAHRYRSAPHKCRTRAAPNAFEKRAKRRVYLRWRLELAQFGCGLRSQQARSFHGAVGKNNVRSGAPQAEQAFRKALVVVKPAVLCGCFEHGVFSAHLVRGYR